MDVPESVTHAQFIGALQPLFDLLGISEYDPFADSGITFSSSRSSGDECGRIHLVLAARRKDDHSARGKSIIARHDLAAPPTSSSALAWVCSVKVTK